MTTKKQREDEAVEDYVWSIRNNINRDWRAYNAVLIEDFGLTAFRRIKERAWKLLTPAKEDGK